MNSLEALIALNAFSGMGSLKLKALIESFGSPEKIFEASEDKILLFGISRQIASKLKAVNKEFLDSEFKFIQQQQLDVITYWDSNYPENLKDIPGAPVVLYVKGKFLPQDTLSIAVIGSRKATFYGISQAEQFAQELSLCGLTIVSGMARGIDAFAHKAALKCGGRTIAVMGSGFNRIYPSENAPLVDQIAERGVVVSEFPVNTSPIAQNFPRRNRIISGLSLGVLVIEAARNSGALITADFALEQGRDVFALPGRIDAQTSSGTNGLIKEGAKLVENADDIIEELEPILKSKIKELKTSQPEPVNKKQILTEPDLSEEEYKVCSLLSSGSLDFDDIVMKTKLPAGVISVILTALELKRLVKQMPGKIFMEEKRDNKI